MAHPNLRVIVTHGGLLSLQEALYHCVPVVGIPLGTDQDLNILRAERNGYAIPLKLQTLTADELVKARFVFVRIILFGAAIFIWDTIPYGEFEASFQSGHHYHSSHPF